MSWVSALLSVGSLVLGGLLVWAYGATQRQLGRTESAKEETDEDLERMSIMAEALGKPVDSNPLSLAERLRVRLRLQRGDDTAPLPSSESEDD